MSCRETIGSHETNGFPSMCQSLCIFDIVDRSEHALFIVVCVQVELGFMASLEGVYSDLNVFRSDVKVVSDVFDESQHLLEVSGADWPRWVQEKDDVSLGITFCNIVDPRLRKPVSR